MNAPGSIDTADGVEPGRMLIRVENDRGMSLSERLAQHFHRLAWRTPLHSLRLRGRYPLKLLGVPLDPIAGEPRAGEAILEGRVAHRGEAIELTELDFANLSVSSALFDHLQSFAWLRDLAAADRAQSAAIAERIIAHWLAVHGGKVSQAVWRPDLCARRILFWAAYAPIILSSRNLVYRSAVLNGLARQARHLDRSADKAVRGLQRVIAWTGVIAAGLLIPGGEGRRLHGEDGLVRALEAAMSADGGMLDRSPLSLLELVEGLSQLMGVYAMRRIDPPAAVATALQRAVPALLGITHGDGGLSSWQGIAPIDASRIEAAVRASSVRARPLRQASDWGYQRMTGGQSRVIVDAAPPPVQRLANGACASTLAFEFSDGEHRLVVNCGGPGGGSADFPAGLADALRATAAHSTLVIADTNSTATYPDGTMGRGVYEVACDRSETDAGSRLEVSHDGYARRFGFLHKRQLQLAANGRELAGEDLLLPAGRRVRLRTVQPVAVRFHLSPDVEVTQTADGLGALLRIDGGPLWQFRCKGGTLSVDESLWVDPSGWPRSTHQLVIATEAPAGGISVSWIFRRAS
jgi:uncharacterized heparinase superfamily protein